MSRTRGCATAAAATTALAEDQTTTTRSEGQASPVPVLTAIVGPLLVTAVLGRAGMAVDRASMVMSSVTEPFWC
jgi:hypothetical protein